MISRHTLWSMIVAAMFLGSSTPAFAAKWWNPLTWFEESGAAKAEKAMYRIERPLLVETVDEAKQTGDKETIEQARAELRDFDKAYDKRLKAIRKKKHETLKVEHKAQHKAAKVKQKTLKVAR